MQIIHPQSTDLVPFVGRAHRLLGLAVVAQIDDSRIALLLQLVEVGLGRLIANGDRRRDRTLDVHGSFLINVGSVRRWLEADVGDSLIKEETNSPTTTEPRWTITERSLPANEPYCELASVSSAAASHSNEAFLPRGDKDVPHKTRNVLLELGVVIVLLAIASPQACAHGGGGRGPWQWRRPWRSRSRRGRCKQPLTTTPAAITTVITAVPTACRVPIQSQTSRAWEGFPEDLPFARLQRFVASHLPSPAPARPASELMTSLGPARCGSLRSVATVRNT